MRRLAVVLLFIALTATAEEKGLKQGFRDLKWGDKPTTDMTLKATDGAATYYTRSTDKLSVGDAELSSIVYGFSSGQLYSARLDVGKYQGLKMLTVLKALWGKGYQPNEYLQEYSWSAKSTFATYSENAVNDTATVLIMDLGLAKKLDEAQKARGAKAKDDM